MTQGWRVAWLPPVLPTTQQLWPHGLNEHLGELERLFTRVRNEFDHFKTSLPCVGQLTFASGAMDLSFS